MPTAHHVHVYFRTAAEREHALALRQAVEARFPDARLGRVHDAPVAFHPAPMFQVALDSVGLDTLIPWLQRHRSDLSLMVHPLTGDVVREHLHDAIWLGTPLALDEERLQRAASAASSPDVAPERPGPTILRIDASARREGSSGRPLADELVERLLHAQPQATVVHRDLANGVPLLDTDALNAWATPVAERTAVAVDAATPSDTLVAELQAADAIVVALPIYNFHVPAAFKAWIDQVARARVTFRYTPNGPVGLLENRPVYVVVTSGGTRLDGPLDFVTPWVRHVFGFLGLHDVHFIAADGLGGDTDARLQAARDQIRRLTPPARQSA